MTDCSSSRKFILKINIAEYRKWRLRKQSDMLTENRGLSAPVRIECSDNAVVNCILISVFALTVNNSQDSL